MTVRVCTPSAPARQKVPGIASPTAMSSRANTRAFHRLRPRLRGMQRDVFTSLDVLERSQISVRILSDPRD